MIALAVALAVALAFALAIALVYSRSQSPSQSLASQLLGLPSSFGRVHPSPMRRRWIVACVLGETLALSVSALLGALVSRAGEESAPWILFATLPLMGLLEGAILGGAQATVLRAFVSPKRWVAATAIGMGLAWLIATLGALVEPETTSPFLIVAAAGLFGVVVGAGVGAAQSAALADRRWIPISVAAWVGALVVSALLSELVPWGPFTPYVLLIEAVKGAAAGLVVGVVTAPMLLRTLAD